MNLPIDKMNWGDMRLKKGNSFSSIKCAIWDMTPNMIIVAVSSSNRNSPMYIPNVI